MTYSDAQQTSRRPATRAVWRRLDSDGQARLWAEAHTYDKKKHGEIVLACRHGNCVGECSLCGLAGEYATILESEWVYWQPTKSGMCCRLWREGTWVPAVG